MVAAEVSVLVKAGDRALNCFLDGSQGIRGEPEGVGPVWIVELIDVDGGVLLGDFTDWVNGKAYFVAGRGLGR